MNRIFIETNIDGKSQTDINQLFSDNFEIIKEQLQAPSVVEILPPNEYGNAFVRAGVVMYTKVDIDYDNPDIEKCRKIVLNDFSSKILTLFKENPFGMTKKTPHCHIYNEINKRWFRYFSSIPITYECKQIDKLIDGGSEKNISSYVQEYINDYMQHNYLGRDVNIPTVDDIRNWCGGGEFPFLEMYLIRNADGIVSLAYYLAR